MEEEGERYFSSCLGSTGFGAEEHGVSGNSGEGGRHGHCLRNMHMEIECFGINYRRVGTNENSFLVTRWPNF